MSRTGRTSVVAPAVQIPTANFPHGASRIQPIPVAKADAAHVHKDRIKGIDSCWKATEEAWQDAKDSPPRRKPCLRTRGNSEPSAAGSLRPKEHLSPDPRINTSVLDATLAATALCSNEERTFLRNAVKEGKTERNLNR